jgi:hypothetical protein
MGVLGKGFSFLDTQFWNEDRCSYFVAKLQTLVFKKIPHIKFFCLILFQQNMGFFVVFFI